MIAAIYVDHELMDSVKNERESDAEGDEKKYNLSFNAYQRTYMYRYYDNIRISVLLN